MFAFMSGCRGCRACACSAMRFRSSVDEDGRHRAKSAHGA